MICSLHTSLLRYCNSQQYQKDLVEFPNVIVQITVQILIVIDIFIQLYKNTFSKYFIHPSLLINFMAIFHYIETISLVYPGKNLEKHLWESGILRIFAENDIH